MLAARFVCAAVGSALVCLSLGGCASRPGPEVLQTVQPSAQGTRHVKVLVATTRKRVEPEQNVFSADRSRTLNFASFGISIPPGHRTSEIEWPEGPPNAELSFAVVQQDALSETAFRSSIVPGRADRRGSEVGVFVHGYNYNFQESLFRVAQLAADGHVQGTPILFSWPSAGSASGYLTDRDAVTYSRDGLVRVLTEVARTRRTGKVLVFGHSMGGWLVMEAVRQLKLTRQEATLSRLRIVLAAPDVDLDVFRQQLDVVGRLNEPLVLLVAKDDAALRLSSRLAGSHLRVGALDVNNERLQEAARKRNVQVIDISNIASADSANHSRFVGLVAMMPRLSAQADGVDNVREAGAFVFDSTAGLLLRPFQR